MDNDGIILMEKFSETITYITLKNHHTWGCPVYVLDARFQEKILDYPSGNRNHVQGSIFVN